MKTDSFSTTASRMVEEYVSSHADVTLAREQLALEVFRNGTHRVFFGNHSQMGPVVLKVFCNELRKENEAFALKWFSPTGFVPKILYDALPRLVVMTRLPGRTIDELYSCGRYSRKLLKNVSGALGNVFAGFGRLGRPSVLPGYYLGNQLNREFFCWSADLSPVLRHYVAIARRIHGEQPSYGTPVFGASVALMEEAQATVLAQPRILYQENLHPNNMMVDHGKLSGLIDLDTVRPGTEAMQLGGAIVSAVGDESRHLDWPLLLQNYERASGGALALPRLRAAVAMAHFQDWIRIARYGTWPGTPWPSYDVADEDDHSPFYRKRFHRYNQILSNFRSGGARA